MQYLSLNALVYFHFIDKSQLINFILFLNYLVLASLAILPVNKLSKTLTFFTLYKYEL